MIVKDFIQKTPGLQPDIASKDEYKPEKANAEAGILTELTDEESEILEKAERIATKLKQWMIDDEVKFFIACPG